jgi:RHS repeat-associated protein
VLEQVHPDGTVYYYHADRLGSVRALTNQAGTVVNTYAYDAYGNTTASTGSITNPFRYAGEYQDAESGLYYLRARYYDPASQQFLTRDPLCAVTGQAYNYAGGSPLNATDPTGQDPSVCGYVTFSSQQPSYKRRGVSFYTYGIAITCGDSYMSSVSINYEVYIQDPNNGSWSIAFRTGKEIYQPCTTYVDIRDDLLPAGSRVRVRVTIKALVGTDLLMSESTFEDIVDPKTRSPWPDDGPYPLNYLPPSGTGGGGSF